MEPKRLLMALMKKEITPKDMMGATIIDVETKEGNKVQWTYKLANGEEYVFAVVMGFDL